MKVARKAYDLEEMPEVFKEEMPKEELSPTKVRNWLSFTQLLAQRPSKKHTQQKPHAHRVRKLEKSKHKMTLASRRINRGTKGRTQRHGK